MSKLLKWTGERLTTDFFHDVSIEHLSRYSLALKYVKDKRVIDVACGEGYGSHLLSQTAKSVIGIDIDMVCIKHASKKYNKANLAFTVASVEYLPFENQSIDVVISFETLEHVADQDKMLQEMKRILRKDGLLILSSPEKSNYSVKRNFTNPFHKKELTKNELEILLQSYFKNISVLGQKLMYGCLIAPLDGTLTGFEEHGGDFKNIMIHSAIKDPMYLIAFCSDIELPKINSSVFNADEVMNIKLSEVEVRFINSWAYKIGKILTYPAKKIRNWLLNQ